MKKKISFFMVVLLLALSSIFISHPLAANNSSTDVNIEYEKDGRVKGFKNAENMSDKALNEVLEKIGLTEESIETLSKREKVDIVKRGGKAIDLQVKSAKTYYVSLDGSRTEYTEQNEEIIKEKKLADLKKYNEMTGDSKSILELSGPEPLMINESQDMVTASTTATGALPPIKTEPNGDLEIWQQVLYLGPWDGHMNYKYISNASWYDAPFNTKTDAFATAFDTFAVAKADSFQANWFQDQAVPDGNGGITYITEEKQLSADTDSFKLYGHGVKVKIGEGSYQNISMSREVLVGTSHIGDPAYILTKYHHTYGTITGLAINIGPAAISFEGAWGDDTILEFNYTYGDVNSWDL
ncbi:hypothetical protein DFO73_1328 [Cytobacillus oceanisediminis]|uniref:Uncharacterized protein n=1 Tax=Cytobacillus oceanisediminis TaxID=665099 RepID=A0A2V2ZAV4_9BACI|nr:hypothetical protein [Cytobacillus oceanisediminis]PWW17078.1 hypothetical protein DFO73_1328 [Cytobacillus oceanisediminis]